MKLLIKLCAVLFCGFLITGCGKSENIKVSEAQSSGDSGQSGNSSQVDKIPALVNHFGPSGWAKCASGQISMSAMIARGDPGVQQLKETNDFIGDLLGSMRQYMLANNIQQAQLDQLLRGSASQIKNGDQAFDIVDQCIKEINGVMASSTTAVPAPVVATPQPTSASEPIANSDKTSIKECDDLAGSPIDPQKNSAGISYDKINAIAAVNACQQAVKIESGNSRLWFELGRALEKSNSIDEAISAYQKAAQLGSASAYNNIGELYRQGKGFPKNKDKAAEFFKKSADLGSTEGRDNLASLSKSK